MLMTEDAVVDGSEEYAALPAPVATEYVEVLMPLARATTDTPTRAMTASTREATPRARTVPAREPWDVPPAEQERGRNMPTPSSWGGKSTF